MALLLSAVGRLNSYAIASRPLKPTAVRALEKVLRRRLGRERKKEHELDVQFGEGGIDGRKDRQGRASKCITNGRAEEGNDESLAENCDWDVALHHEKKRWDGIGLL